MADLFNYLTGFSRHAGYRQILVSPVTLRPRVLELIDEQAAAGPDGRIVMKLNGLTDPEMIDALYRASAAGVPVDLAVRGLCCLRPGIPGLSETIRVRSLVGQFLEHSRIYRFGGGDDPVPHQGTGDGGGRAPATAAHRLGRPHGARTWTGASRCWCRCATPNSRPGCSRSSSWSSPMTSTPGAGPGPAVAAGTPRHGVSSQERLKELAIERARRRREEQRAIDSA